MSRTASFLSLVTVLALAVPAVAAEDVVAQTTANLVLAGGGPLSPAVRARFVELAGGKKAKLVILSHHVSAPDPEKVLAPWKELGVASAVVLQAANKDEATKDAFLAPLAEATGVWLDGEDPAEFAATYRNAHVVEALRKLMARGGFVGATAPLAELAGQTWDRGPRAKPRFAPGFGWLPHALVQTHLLKANRVDALQAALRTKPGLLGLGIDAGAAVVLRGRLLHTMGDSYVVCCLAPSARRPASVQVLDASERRSVADLVALQKAALARAASPFPADKPAAPVVAKGALIIGGGGGMPVEGWKQFIELAGGPDALIVVIPTALEDPLPAEIGEVRALKRFGAKNIKVLHTRSRTVADTEDFAAPLRKAGGVWFSGGRQWKFVDAYEGTLTEKLFHDVLKRGGVIGGSSAGASIQTEYMPRGHPLGNQVMMAEGYERGFGFLPGVAVDQHFFARKRTGDMSDLVRVYPQLLGIGIDEGTIILVKGSVFEVIGKSKVAVYDRGKPTSEDGKDYEELAPGMRYDLEARKRLEGKKD